MYALNRLSVLMRWKKPMLEWVNGLPNDGSFSLFTEEDLDDESTTFLIPHFESLDEADKYLDEVKPMLFEMELESWAEDPKVWPVFRNKKMFDEWFELKISSMTVDLGEEELVREEI